MMLSRYSGELLMLCLSSEEFQRGLDVDVSKYVEKRGGLDYISWSAAIILLKQHFPDLLVEAIPYKRLEGVSGFLVEARVTRASDGESTPYMVFPVYDYKHKALLEPTTADVSNAIQRATVKVIAQTTGIGLKLYLGEETEHGTETVQQRAAHSPVGKRADLPW